VFAVRRGGGSITREHCLSILRFVQQPLQAYERIEHMKANENVEAVPWWNETYERGRCEERLNTMFNIGKRFAVLCDGANRFVQQRETRVEEWK